MASEKGNPLAGMQGTMEGFFSLAPLNTESYENYSEMVTRCPIHEKDLKRLGMGSHSIWLGVRDSGEHENYK